MKTILFARVSTEEQKMMGNSLPAQLERLKKYAKEKDLKVFKTIQFDESAWKANRKKFKEVIEDLKKSKEKTALCCDKIDRLLRGFTTELLDIENLRTQNRLELHFPSDNIILHQDSPASDLFRFTMGVSLAKYYSDSIRDGVKRTFEKKFKKGEITGKAPIGYLNVGTEKGKKTVVIDVKRASFIKKIFQLYSTGNYSMNVIAQIVSKDGLRSNTNSPRKLKVRQIEEILKNPFYYGCQKHKGKLYPHIYPTLVSFELWEKCEKVRSGFKTRPTKHSEKPFYFRGLMKCSRCGCMITPEFKKKRYVYYHCTNYKGNCEKIYVKQEDLLSPIFKVLDGIVLTQEKITELIEELKMRHEEKSSYNNSIFKQLNQEYNKIDKMISVMYEDRLDGRITMDMYDKKLADFEKRKKVIEERLSRIGKIDESDCITAKSILSLAQRAPKIFKSSKPKEKRHFINFLFQNLELDGENLDFKLKTPFDTVLLANKSEDCSIWGG